jgi:nucleolar pre-ribosomal-associated protein 1
MSKRERPVEEDDRPPKRPRQEFQPPQIEEIHFARQLQQFLTFRQDGLHQLRNGIASFKNFLEIILYHREPEDRARQISILREYLETQKPTDPHKDVDQPFLTQLWQAWSFANQNNNDHLASQTSAVIALLLKTLSGILDLREQGLLLCRTVLQHQHLRLVKRCLDAPKHKDFLISPCLRLLTEVSAFDGGLLVRELYKRREQTFDVNTIRRSLGLAKTDISEEEAKRKPAIRTLTLRYVLSLLKHLHEGGKIDILKSKPVCNALFQHLNSDPADLVAELLSTVEQSILKNADVPRSSKAAILTPQNLERVTDIARRNSEEHAAAEKAFTWLKAVCSEQSFGILRKSGWYPPGTTTSARTTDGKTIDLGLDSLDFYDRATSINVRNSTLLSYVLTLRAHIDEHERELLLTCFRSAPELVAAYSAEKSLQLDPKLSNTWIGYAALMFEIARLPVPTRFGETEDMLPVPPQTAILIENILPRPLTQQVLTRCMNQSNDLITFFAVRILVLSLQKLKLVLQQLREHEPADGSGLWEQARERLVQRFVDRCPHMRDIIAVFRKMPDDDQRSLQREAVTRLLCLYYEVLPLQALEEQFDVSGALTAALLRTEAPVINKSDETKGLRHLQLQHLLTIAGHSTGMKWFHKQGGLTFSPIVTLLRIHRLDVTNKELRMLVGQVLIENNVLTTPKKADDVSSLDALVASVLKVEDSGSTWEFIDDCIGRAVRKPIKYIDDLESLALPVDDKKKKKKKASGAAMQMPSVIAAVLLEQAPFVKSKDDNSTIRHWIHDFLTLQQATSDAGPVLAEIVKKIHKILGSVSESELDATEILAKVRKGFEAPVETGEPAGESTRESTKDRIPAYSPPPEEPSSHPELLRWAQKDIDLAIEDGDISALMLDLCSEHSDIRKQSFLQLQKFKLRLDSSPTSESNTTQISLLVGELCETFSQHYLHRKPRPLTKNTTTTTTDLPLPYIAGTFASRALHVLTTPAHAIYPKLNKYLLRGPEWRISRLPGWWLSATLLDLPDDDDAHWSETAWVLDWLVDGLRAPRDLDVLRRAEVFERVLALHASPGLRAGRGTMLGRKISELLWRAAGVDGGADVLLTRVGVLAWADAAGDVGAAVRERVLARCDRERARAWSGLKALEMKRG